MNPYSLEDIERYLQGKLSPAEMHELEKAAVQDPFLADAIEGYQSADLTLVKQDLAGIHSQLASEPAKIIPAGAKKITWWRIAAAVILLAGAGIIGSKLFTDNNDTSQVAVTQPVTQIQKEVSPSVPEKSANIVADAQLQKTEPLAKASVQKHSAENNGLADNVAAYEKEVAKPPASSAALVFSNQKQPGIQDSSLVAKDPVKDLVAGNTLGLASTTLLSPMNVNAQIGGFLNKGTDPNFSAKKETINNILANGSITLEARRIPLASSFPGRKDGRKDTIKLDKDDMPVFSRAGYFAPEESAITSIGGLSLITVTGKEMAKKRSGISIDTPLLNEQKKMFITFSDVQTTPVPAPLLFETMKPKKDTVAFLTDAKIADYFSANNSSKKEKGSANTAPEPDVKKGLGSGVRETFSVIPAGGWQDFIKYLNGKVADETGTRYGPGQHGSVKIKMNISEKGKVSKVIILESFNPELNHIIIKAIEKKQRWVASDHLAKKDYTFMIVL